MMYISLRKKEKKKKRKKEKNKKITKNYLQF